MDYETGTATNAADLISKLGTFAAGDGWTVSSVTGGVVFRKGTVVVGVATDADEVFLRGAITYNGGAAWNAQTNNSGVNVAINCGAGPFPSYHFFSGDEDSADYLHVAFEISAGIYHHFVMGELIKSGAYTGGVYVDGTNWSTSTSNQNFPESSSSQAICDTVGSNNTAHIWIDYDSKSNNWQRLGLATASTTTLCSGGYRGQSIDSFLQEVGYMDWNMRNLMKPLRYFANRSDSLKSFIGRIPHMRGIYLQNLSPAEVISIGGDDWMVLPLCQRTESFNNNPSAIPSSGYLGYAYRMP
jgi:hypothetical protein